MSDLPEPSSDKRPMARRLLEHGGVYTAARIANQGLVFLLLPLYARKLGSEGLGIIEVTNAMRNVLVLVFLQGLHFAWFRLRVLYKEPEAQRSFEATVIWYLMGSAAVLLSTLVWLGDGLSRWLTPGVPFFPLGLLTAATAAALIFPTLLERKFQIQQQSVRLATFSIARSFVTLVTIVIFVVFLERGAAGKIEAELLVALGLVVVSLAWLRPAGPKHVDRAKLRTTLSYGWPHLPHSLSGLVNDMIDRVMVSAALGLAAVGVYSIGYRIGSITMMLMMSVSQAFSPLFVEVMHDAQEKERAGDADGALTLRRNVATAGMGMVTLAAIVAQGVTATGREVMTLVAPVQTPDAWPVVAVVCFAVVIWSCYACLIQSMYFNLRSARFASVVGVLSACSNVVANMYLIPAFGIMGAAWATLLSNTVYMTLAYRIGMHYAPVPYPWARGIRLLLWTALSLAAFHACDAMLTTLIERMVVKAVLLTVSLLVTVRLAGVNLATARALRDKLRDKLRGSDD